MEGNKAQTVTQGPSAVLVYFDGDIIFKKCQMWIFYDLQLIF